MEATARDPRLPGIFCRQSSIFYPEALETPIILFITFSVSTFVCRTWYCSGLKVAINSILSYFIVTVFLSITSLLDYQIFKNKNSFIQPLIHLLIHSVKLNEKQYVVDWNQNV